MNSNHQDNPVAQAHPDQPAPTRSRGRFLLAAGIAGVLTISTLGACGHHRSGGWHGKNTDPAARVEHMVDKVFSHVDASDEQKAKITSIATDALAELSPLRGKVRDSRTKALELLTADNIDRSAVEALRSEQLKNIDTASATASAALADIAEVLTPAQRAQVREKIASRMNKRRGWGRWGHGS